MSDREQLPAEDGHATCWAMRYGGELSRGTCSYHVSNN